MRDTQWNLNSDDWNFKGDEDILSLNNTLSVEINFFILKSTYNHYTNLDMIDFKKPVNEIKNQKMYVQMFCAANDLELLEYTINLYGVSLDKDIVDIVALSEKTVVEYMVLTHKVDLEGYALKGEVLEFWNMVQEQKQLNQSLNHVRDSGRAIKI